MTGMYKQIAGALAVVATVLLAQSPVTAANAAPDTVGKAWKARAEAAKKKLAAPGLDKCDKGLALAFQHPEETNSEKLRSFTLMVNIDGQTLAATYAYTGERLISFLLYELPLEWLAEQKTDSKTLRIIVESAKCSFDLCTNDPFSPGPCVVQHAQ